MILRPLILQDVLDDNVDEKGKPLPVADDHKANLEKLLKKVNKVQERYGKLQFIVTSGLRSLRYHLLIYRKKGITDPKKIPMKSKHLFGHAVDIEDKDGKFYAWVQKNEAFLQELGLHYELGTKGWVHLQSVPPGSGKIGFWP
jgi:hypothetical protein